MSRVLEGNNGYNFVVALVPVMDERRIILKKRFFYKSHSGGGWRGCPYQEFSYDEWRRVIKILSKLEHYTQSTEPADELLAHLNACTDDPSYQKYRVDSERVLQYFSVDSPALAPVHQRTLMLGPARERGMYEDGGNALKEIQSYPAGGAFHPGAGLSGRSAVDLIQVSERLPHGFVPDFSQNPENVQTYRHASLGEVVLETYAGGVLDGKPILWTMASDREGRVWCQSIRFRHASVTSYGIYDPVIDSGFLTSKPLEYPFQVHLLDEKYKRDFNGEYRDITPLLAELAPIKAYIEAKGIYRGLPVRIRPPQGGGPTATHTMAC